MELNSLITGWNAQTDGLRVPMPVRVCGDCGSQNVTRGDAGQDKLWRSFKCRACMKKLSPDWRGLALAQRCERCTRAANWGPAGGGRSAATR
jgi:hypothetical protein